MKKVIALLLILLSFIIIPFKNTSAINIFKEGIYKPSDLTNSPSGIYTFQNVSSNANAVLVVINPNQIILQSIFLEPNPQKFETIPIRHGYKLVIAGPGEVYIAPK